jgi:hypothetical protein
LKKCKWRKIHLKHTTCTKNVLRFINNKQTIREKEKDKNHYGYIEKAYIKIRKNYLLNT